MKPSFAVTWTIARRDFVSFFSSPKGMAIFFFFLLFMGFFFHSFLESFIQMQQRAPAMGGNAPQLEQLFRALFNNTHFILLLIVPAVTMASFAEENKSHSIRLLLTAPVRPISIVLGKYLATLMVMSLVLLSSMMIVLFTAKYGTPDIAVLLSGYLGLFFLISTQLAIGIWISSMTTNQFLAFMFTMLVLFLLLILNWIAQTLSAGGGVMEDLLMYLAFWGHLENMVKGLITVKDVVYFVGLTSVFLFFTNVVLDSRRWR